jgi:metal-responsive CopG/Arc/MetJ family transcriptional regulator
MTHVSKKVIQIPIEEDLLEALDAVSRSEKRSRAELIRLACRDFLRRRRMEYLDRLYQAGYERVPEDSAIGESQVALLGQVLDEETW